MLGPSMGALHSPDRSYSASWACSQRRLWRESRRHRPARPFTLICIPPPALVTACPCSSHPHQSTFCTVSNCKARPAGLLAFQGARVCCRSPARILRAEAGFRQHVRHGAAGTCDERRHIVLSRNFKLDGRPAIPHLHYLGGDLGLSTISSTHLPAGAPPKQRCLTLTLLSPPCCGAELASTCAATSPP